MDKQPPNVENLGNTVDTPDEANMSEASDNVQSVTTGLVETPETYLLKGSEVRDLLHIGRTTLHEWRERGEIVGIRHRPDDPRSLWYYPANQPIIQAALRAVGSIR